MQRRHLLHTAALGALSPMALASRHAHAQAASRTLRVLIPTGPGGTTDNMHRTTLPRVESELGQTVVLDYKPGAAGIAAIQSGLGAPADGSTLIGVYTSLAFNPWTYQKLSYDTFKDLEMVSLLVNIPLVLAVGPAVPAKTVPELVAWGKANPGKLTIAASGLGGGSHLGGLLLAMTGGFDLTVVPYKGGAAALPDLLAGRVALMLDAYQTLRPHAEAGKLTLLGVSSTRRQEFAPELAPISDSLPGYATASWQGVAVRAGTPAAEKERIARAYGQAMRDPAIRATLVAQGLEPVGSSPKEFTDVLQADYEKWGPVIRKAGLKSD